MDKAATWLNRLILEGVWGHWRWSELEFENARKKILSTTDIFFQLTKLSKERSINIRLRRLGKIAADDSRRYTNLLSGEYSLVVSSAPRFRVVVEDDERGREEWPQN